MDNELKQKISEEYGLPTSFMTQPPRDVEDRIQSLLKILLTHPPREDDNACLLVKSKSETRWQTLDNPYTIGCHPDSSLQLLDKYISQRHCEIRKSDNIWIIEDLGSTNGIYINQTKLARKVLRDGDMIQIGGILVIYLGEK